MSPGNQPKIREKPQIYLLEPSERLSREHLIASKMRKQEYKAQGTDQIKKELKTVREYALKNQKRNVKALTVTLQKNGIDTYYAKSSSDAALHISDALKKSKLKDVCINNSTAVKEIIGNLPSDITVFDTYHASQKGIEDAKHLEFWEVPRISDDHLWKSFDFQKIKYKEPLGFASLIGANAVSSSDASFFFVQHFNNISSVMSRSKETFLVVGLEKIVSDAQDAHLVLRASGLFGLRSLLLGIMSHDTPLQKLHVDELANRFSRARSADTNLHVIILDNGRSKISKSDFSDFLLCINCRACGAVCPRSLFLGEGEFRTPRELVLLRFTGGLARTVEEGLYNCSLCGACELACPLEIPLPDFLQSIRNEAVKENLTPKKHVSIGENVKTFGNPYGRGD